MGVNIDFAEIRRLVVISVFADDWLMRRLVLKGGNALNLIYHIGSRTSLDVDFSLEDDFLDLEDVRRRLQRALADRFDSAGYVVIDFSLRHKPLDPRSQPPTWGGYLVEFKIIRRERHTALVGDRSRQSVQAELVAPRQRRIIRVEISKYEFCEPKTETELDGYTIYVYTPAMIAIEKLRAICQQMPEYLLVPLNTKRARARDFYDIHAILKATELDLGAPGNLALARQIFAVKEVPLTLISRIREHREFHRPDWSSVEDSVTERLEGYDVYFDFVVEATRRLHPLWEE